jgi:enoyl-CoA hydratase/carnithine racemase
MQGDVAVLTLNRPEVDNAMNGALLHELADATQRLVAQRDLRGLVVAGAGRSFSRGGDLVEYREQLEEEGFDPVTHGNRSTAALASTIGNLRRIGCPVVAAVNGQAAGAGFSLALACDARVAARQAVFHFAYGMIGASPDGGMSWLLPRVVTPARALELLLEQPVLRAPRALEEGLVSEVVPADELLEASLRRVRRLGAIAPHSIRSVKRLLARSLDLPLEEHLELERAAFATGLATEDLRNGITALLSGDWPQFRNR